MIFLHGDPGTPNEVLPYGTAELNAAGYDVYSYDQIGAGGDTHERQDTTGLTLRNGLAWQSHVLTPRLVEAGALAWWCSSRAFN